MRAVVQRVKEASVTIEGAETRSIGPGLVVLLGVCEDDSVELCKRFAEKTAGLRIFDDADGNLNISAQDLGLSVLVVSNFTLYGNTKKGMRPSFIRAAKPPLSVDCYEEYVRCLRALDLAEVQTGEFGAEMQLSLVNDGPITLILDTEEWKKA